MTVPTYSYECGKCGHRFDVFHGMSATPKVKCESCGSTKTTKQLGTGAGFIFKGSGFYETDFKDKKGAPDKKAEAAPAEGKTETKTEPKAEPKPKTETKVEAKPAPKAESKPAASKSARKPKA